MNFLESYLLGSSIAATLLMLRVMIGGGSIKFLDWAIMSAIFGLPISVVVYYGVKLLGWV